MPPSDYDRRTYGSGSRGHHHLPAARNELLTSNPIRGESAGAGPKSGGANVPSEGLAGHPTALEGEPRRDRGPGRGSGTGGPSDSPVDPQGVVVAHPINEIRASTVTERLRVVLTQPLLNRNSYDSWRNSRVCAPQLASIEQLALKLVSPLPPVSDSSTAAPLALDYLNRHCSSNGQRLHRPPRRLRAFQHPRHRAGSRSSTNPTIGTLPYTRLAL